MAIFIYIIILIRCWYVSWKHRYRSQWPHCDASSMAYRYWMQLQHRPPQVSIYFHCQAYYASIKRRRPLWPSVRCRICSKPSPLLSWISDASSLFLFLDHSSEAKRAIDNILCLGCRTCIITLGKDGAIFASSSDPRPIHVRGPKVEEVVDTTVSLPQTN